MWRFTVAVLVQWWGVALAILTALGVVDYFLDWRIGWRKFAHAGLALLLVGAFFAWRDTDKARSEAQTQKANALTAANDAQRALADARVEIERLRVQPEQRELNALKETLAMETAARERDENELAMMRMLVPPPRFITDEVEQAITERLRALGSPASIDIMYRSGCDNCRRVAAALLRALQAAEWNIPTFEDRAFPDLAGIFLSSPVDGDEDRAQSIRDLLADATHLPCKYARHQGDGMWIMVGASEAPEEP